MNLLPKVFRTEGDMGDFDPLKIFDSLIKETGMTESNAKFITEQVVRRIISSSIKFLSGPHIREIVCSILSEQHFEEERKLYTRIGMPLMDYEEILEKKEPEKLINPEKIHHRAANQLAEEYTLLRILNDDQSKAHLYGDIHIHMLKYFDLRPSSQIWDPRNILKYGLPPINIPTQCCKSGPANNLAIAAHQLATWLGMTQGEFSENQGYDFISIFLAPYIKNLSDKDIKYGIQNLIYEINQLSGIISREFPTTLLSFTPEIIHPFLKIPAISFNGEINGVYGDYLEECERLFDITTEIFKSGDFHGQPFLIPKHLIYFDKNWLNEKNQLYMNVWDELIKTKTPIFINFSCDWLKSKIENQILENTFNNYGILQSICLNLPRYAYMSSSEDNLFELLNDMIDLSSEILLKKYDLIRRRLKSKHLPLCSSMINDNILYDLRNQNLAISFVGLNESVKYITNSELHDNSDSFKFGKKIIEEIKKRCMELSNKNKKNFIVVENNSEKPKKRFAKLDLIHFKTKLKKLYLNKNISYTNSSHFREDINMDNYIKIKKQGEFQSMIQNEVIENISLKYLDDNYKKFNDLLDKICSDTEIVSFKFN